MEKREVQPLEKKARLKRFIPKEWIDHFPAQIKLAMQALPQETPQGAFKDFLLIQPLISQEKAQGWFESIKDYDAIDDTLQALGWHELSSRRGPYYGFSSDQKVEDLYARLYTILKLSLAAPKSIYGYHGTLSKHIPSLKINGLNNDYGESRIDNSSFQRLGFKRKVSLAADLDYALDFATDGIVLRIKLKSPIQKSEIIADDNIIAPDKLEVSLDSGKTWQPLLDL